MPPIRQDSGRRQSLLKASRVKVLRRRPAVEILEGRALLATLFVAPSGSDANTPGNPSAPLLSLQHAVTVARSGDVILLAAGTYGYNQAADAEGNYSTNFGAQTVFTLINKQLSIVGGYSTSNWSVYNPAANPTFIDGNNKTRGIFVQGSGAPTSLLLKGLTVTQCVARGLAARGGVPAGVDAIGGGMVVYTAPVFIQDVTFARNQAIGNNTAGAIGGAGAGGGFAIASTTNTTTATLQNVIFTGNTSQGGAGATRGGYGHGGGIFADNATVNGTNLVFANNQAIGGFTPGYGIDSNGELADGLGGAFDIHIGAIGNFNGVKASGNQAIGGNAPNGNAGGGYGGGLYAERGVLNVVNADSRFNTARGGSGINNDTGGAGFGNGGGLATYNTNTNISQSSFVGNIAQGGNGAVFQGTAGGGGLALLSTPQTGANITITLFNSLVADNAIGFGGGTNPLRGGGGGGLWLDGPTVHIAHSTITGNRLFGTLPNAGYMQGQAILVGPATPTTLNLSYSIIADHLNTLNSGSIVAAALSAHPNRTINLNRNLFARNSRDTNINGQPSPAGVFNFLGPNISTQNPAGFVSPGAPQFNYRLNPSSPAVNAAVGSNFATDLAGSPRTGVPDIGAFELAPIVVNNLDFQVIVAFGGPQDVAITGDFDGDGKTDYAVYGPVNREVNRFAVQQSKDGFRQQVFGASQDRPIIGDFDGDGKSDFGVYGPAGNGFSRFAVLRSSTGFGSLGFGGLSDQPIAADFDGDGKTDFAVYGPAGNGISRFAAMRSSAGFYQQAFGSVQDQPVVGDFDGDRKTDLAVYGPAGNGISRFALLQSTAGFAYVAFGGVADRPAVGDFDGDGKTDVGVFGPAANGFNRFAALRSSAGFFQQTFGAPAYTPLGADFDGDGKTDLALYIPGQFASLPSSRTQLSATAGLSVAARAVVAAPIPEAPSLALFTRERSRTGGFPTLG